MVLLQHASVEDKVSPSSLRHSDLYDIAQYMVTWPLYPVVNPRSFLPRELVSFLGSLHWVGDS